MNANRENAHFTILILLGGAGFLLTAVALSQTLLPLRAGFESFSPIIIGWLGTSYFAGFIGGCIYGPQLVKSVGHIRAFSGVVAFSAALTLMLPYWPNVFLWLLLRCATGIAMAIAYMVIESWLNEQSDNTTRGRTLSIYVIITNIATMVGQLLVNTAEINSSALFTLTAVLSCFAVVPIALTPTREPAPIPSAKLELKALLAISPAGTIGCLLVGMVEGAFWTLGPTYAQLNGMSIFEVTLLMASFVLGGTLSQWPLGRLSDQRDRRLVILPVAACAVITGLLIAYLPLSNLWFMLVLTTLHGALMVPLYALCLAHVNDSVVSEKLVQISSGLLLIYSLGAVIGPVAAAQLMATIGAGGLFVFIAAVLAVLAIVILYRMVFGPPSERITSEPFAPLPKTSQSVFELEVDDD